MFTQAIEKILADACTPAVVRAVEQGQSPAALWQALEDSGFLELLSTEEDGGAGLALADVYPILLAFGRYALPVPAAQSIAARALLQGSGVRAPAGMLTLAGSARREADGSLCAAQVSFGLLAQFALVNLDGDLLLLDCAQAQREPAGGHGTLFATLRWPAAAVPAAIASNGEALRSFSAAIQAAAMAGAMEWLFGKTLEYCNDRVQFGKAIGKFQTVQHQLSVMAEQVAAAGVAAALAFCGSQPVPALLPAAIGKARTAMAVPLVAATAHALHGAIGVTEELDLQLYTRRLHEWRLAEGSEHYWNRIVGEALLASAPLGASEFVRTVTQSA
ncbi:acyl-CoA dehydrogenase family protein [Aquipseudomonas ullengensis]|uniref:Acyl-CoA dehydrogenase n=1 Tax=Aquipseudomonas ullengensis TaxID=2759166 RepID=A0A7W4LPR9_9GAMM|nr:acyl-CoA dehydrogenase family protein [Pseudomonas ullengensis]MBB2497104.1 acyl-CoA dehydrogenase [Pseudomonas ullengensis]